jgi:hypothetical protein
MNGYGGLDALLSFLSQYQSQQTANQTAGRDIGGLQRTDMRIDDAGAPDAIRGGDLAQNQPAMQPDVISGGDLPQNQPAYNPYTPYTMPYYQRQFGQGYQPATGYRTALYGQYRPMGGALFGQNMGSYSPYGMGGGKGGGYNPYGGYGSYGGYGPFGGQSGGKGGAI